MRLSKQLFLITLIAGISITVVGLQQEFYEEVTYIYADRFGNRMEGTVTGLGVLLIGVLLLLVSPITYNWYKKEKKKLDKWE